MPDLGSSKASSKGVTSSKAQPLSLTSSKTIKGSNSKRPNDRSSSPHRRPNKRARSSSDSKSSDSSSSSGSDSDGSSSSSSSQCSKGSPKKAVVAKTQEVKTNASRSKPVITSRPVTHSTKQSEEPVMKSNDSRSSKDSTKKTSMTLGESVKPTESTSPESTQVHSTITDKVDVTAPPAANAMTELVTDVTAGGAIQPAAKPLTTAVIPKSNKPSESEAVTCAIKHNSTSPEAPSFTRVLVEKLTRNVTKTHVTEIFSVWGEIEYVDMPPDRLHPEFSRSYAYVTYRKPKSAMDAVSFMNGGQIDGETIRVTEVFSRSSNRSRGAPGSNADPRSSHRDHDREEAKRNVEKPGAPSRGADRAAAPSIRHSVGDTKDRSRDREQRPSMDDLDRRRDRERQRERDREHERTRDRQRDRIESRDRGRGSNAVDRAPRRTRRGSSGSPFANRSGFGPVQDRPRSPVGGSGGGSGGSRYRRPSPPPPSRTESSSHRRVRSRSPLAKPLAPPAKPESKPAGSRVRRRGATSTSSSTTSRSSSSSSSSSHSGSASSSSSSASSSSASSSKRRSHS